RDVRELLPQLAAALSDLRPSRVIRISRPPAVLPLFARLMYRPLDHPLIQRLRDQGLFSAGPIGSTLLSLNLKADAFVSADGEAHDGCPEWLNASRPDVLEGLYASFYEVGVDAVDSCSFGANRVVLAEFGLADRTRELNKLAAEVIGRVRDRFSTPDHPRYSF